MTLPVASSAASPVASSAASPVALPVALPVESIVNNDALLEIFNQTQHIDHSRRIAICVDGTESSTYAFEWALKNLINAALDQVILLNVRASPIVKLDATTSALDLAKEQSITLLQEHCSKLVALNISVKALALLGVNAQVEILNRLEAEKCEIVVMGRNDGSSMKKFLIGSTSDYVFRHAECTVIIPR